MTETHRFAVRIYYEDTDFSGNVYHAAYLKFFERGRTEFLRAHGIGHAELAKQGLAFAVRSMSIEFDAAAHIDDLLTVTTEVAAVSGARLTLDQAILRDEGVLTRAKVEVVAIKTSGGAARMPKTLIERYKLVRSPGARARVGLLTSS
jgi:acyl-CoA thioester hydrolase